MIEKQRNKGFYISNWYAVTKPFKQLFQEYVAAIPNHLVSWGIFSLWSLSMFGELQQKTKRCAAASYTCMQDGLFQLSSPHVSNRK